MMKVFLLVLFSTFFITARSTETKKKGATKNHLCSYVEETVHYRMKTTSNSRHCQKYSKNCDNPDFPFLQCKSEIRCIKETTRIPETKTIYQHKTECCPGWSESGWFFLRSCKKHTSCITLPQFTPEPCVIERKTNLETNQRIYHLTTPSENVPETISEDEVTESSLLDFVAFPILNMTSEQVVKLTLSDPNERGWAIEYKSMGDRMRKVIEETTKPENFKFFSNFSDYADLLDLYRKAQHTGGPADKYFRFPSQEEEFKDIIKSDRWQEDEVFVEQRVAGVNPMMIRKLNIKEYESKRSNFNSDLDKAVTKTTGQLVTLFEMVKKGLIYIAEYPLMSGLSNIPDVLDLNPNDKRKMRRSQSPTAFFVSVKNFFTNQYELKPLAIQMDLNATAPVFTPFDGGKWMLAKEEVQLADLAHVEMIEHLLKAHILTEPICVTLKRTLSDHHPLYQILKWHCFGLFMTNSLGLPALIKPTGLMNRLFAIGHVGAIELLNKGYQELSWQVSDFEGNLKERGVFDAEKLPYFPYRDDGLVIWRLTRSFANEYVDLYYKNKHFVQQDTELQNFANELSAEGTGPNGGMGMLKGFPSNIETKRQLKDVLARIIFTPLQHHTVNYPVAYYGGFVPNMPSKLYDDPRAPKDVFSFHSLPQTQVATVQVATFMIIGTIRYDNYLDYASQLSDEKAGNIVKKYYNILMGPTLKLLQERNKKRFQDGHATYPYFLPGWIPNSIHT